MPETMDIPILKAWAYNNDAGKIRPSSVTIRLLADGTETASLELNAANEWKGTFKDLPVNKSGVKIVYTIKEDPIANYKVKIEGSPEEGFKVTNTPPDIPGTGDENNLWLWVGLLGGSAVVIAAVLFIYLKKRREKK